MPRPSAISVASAREVTSRAASSILFGAYFFMKRSPSELSRYAPSPRAASVIRKPLPASVVGWYWTIAMSIKRRAGAIGERVSVAGADQRVRARLVEAPEPAARDDDGLGAQEVQLAGDHLERDDSAARAALHVEVGGEPLFVDLDAGLEDLIVERDEQRLPGDVADEIGARLRSAAERARAELAVGAAIEDHAHVLELDDVGRAPRGT